MNKTNLIKIIFLLLFSVQGFSQSQGNEIIFPKIRQDNTQRYVQLRAVTTNDFYLKDSKYYTDSAVFFTIKKYESTGTVGNWARVYVNSVQVVTKSMTYESDSNRTSWWWPNDDSYPDGEGNIDVKYELWTNGGIWPDSRVGYKWRYFYVDNTSPLVSATYTTVPAGSAPIAVIIVPEANEEEFTPYTIEEVYYKPFSFTIGTWDDGDGIGVAEAATDRVFQWRSLKENAVGGFEVVQTAGNQSTYLHNSAEGLTQVTINGSDLLGNSGLSYSSPFLYIDLTGPIAVNEASISSLSQQDGVLIQWDATRDEYTNVEYYNLQFTETRANGQSDPNANSFSLNNVDVSSVTDSENRNLCQITVPHTFFRHDRDKSGNPIYNYTLTITAVDSVGHSTTSGSSSPLDISGVNTQNTDYIEDFDQISDPSDFFESHLTPVTNNNPAYYKYFRFDKPDDYFVIMDQFSVYYETDTASVIYNINPSTTLTGLSGSWTQISGTNGNIAFWRVVTDTDTSGQSNEYVECVLRIVGEEYAHNNIGINNNNFRFDISYIDEYTWNDKPVGATLTPVPHGSDKVFNTTSDIFPNNPAHLALTFVNNKGETDPVEVSRNAGIYKLNNGYGEIEINGDYTELRIRAFSSDSSSLLDYELDSINNLKIKFIPLTGTGDGGSAMLSVPLTGTDSNAVFDNTGYIKLPLYTGEGEDREFWVSSGEYEGFFSWDEEWTDPDSGQPASAAAIESETFSILIDNIALEPQINTAELEYVNSATPEFKLLMAKGNGDDQPYEGDVSGIDTVEIAIKKATDGPIVDADFIDIEADENVNLERFNDRSINFEEDGIDPLVLFYPDLNDFISDFDSIKNTKIDFIYAIRVTDNAGNVNYLVEYNMHYDPIAPEFPGFNINNENIAELYTNNTGFSADSGNPGTISEITFDAINIHNSEYPDDTDLKYHFYLGSANDGNLIGTSYSINGNGFSYAELSEGRLSIKPNSGFAANYLFPLTLVIEDMAGNKLTLSEGTANRLFLHSPAKIGSVSAIGPENMSDNNDGTVNVAFTLDFTSGDVVSVRPVIYEEYLNDSGQWITSGQIAHQDCTITNGGITISGLLPHHRYNIELRPINACLKVNDINVVSAYDSPLPDRIPVMPDVLEPQSYINTMSPEFVISYPENGETDADGDSLIYSLYINDTIYGTFDSSESVYEATDAIDPLIAGEKHDWKITIAPTHDGSDSYYNYLDSLVEYWQETSVTGSMTVDLAGPEITIATESVSRDDVTFLSDENFNFTVTDDNELEEISVYRINPDTLSETEVYSNSFAGETNVELEITIYDGSWLYRITAKDIAGNTTTFTSTIKKTDRDNPVISSMVSGDGQVGPIWYYRDSFPFTVYASDVSSSVQEIWLEAETEDGVELPYAFYSATGTDGVFTGNYILEGYSGKEITFRITAYDEAANSSEVFELGSCVVFDKTGPENAIVRLDGERITEGAAYYNNTASINAVGTAVDEETGVTMSFRIAESGGNWQSEVVNAAGETTFEDGERYSIEMKAVNGTGLSSFAKTESFIFDGSAPLFNMDSVVFENYAGSLTDGDVVRIHVQASDPDSQIYKLSFGLGEMNGSEFDPVLTKAVTLDGWLSSGGSDAVFTFTLPDNISGTYSAVLKAENYAGLVSEYQLDGITVIQTDEKLVIHSPEEFTNVTDSIIGSWEYKGDNTVDYYTYSILVQENGSQIAAINGTTTETSFNELPSAGTLSDGREYSFDVTAYFANTSDTLTASSFATTIDTVLPDIDGAITAAPLFSGVENLAVTFGATDSLSGIDKSTISILRLVTDEDGKPVLDEDDAVQFTVITDQPLVVPDVPEGNLQFVAADYLDGEEPEHLFVLYRVSDKAGNIAEWMSQPVNMDYSCPEQPIVHDSGDYFRTDLQNELYFTWIVPGGDAESGIVEYKYQWVGANQLVDDAAWEPLESTEPLLYTNIATPGGIANGQNLFLAVKAVNGAGMESDIGISNGICNDITQAVVTDITVEGENGLALFYISELEDVSVGFTVTEGESSLAGGTAVFGVYGNDGQFQNLTENMPFTFEDFTNGSLRKSLAYDLTDLDGQIDSGDVIFYKVYAENSVGLITESVSRGIMFDNIQPELTSVFGYCAGSSLYYSWDISTHYAPLQSFHVDISDIYGTGGSHGESITDIHQRSFELDADEKGFGGGIYKMDIEVTNFAGTTSTGSSNGVMYDNTAPELVDGSFVTKPFAASNIRFQAQFSEDPYGRISEYMYCVGTVDDPGLVSDGWISTTDVGSKLYKELSLDNLPSGIENIIDGSTLYVRVRAGNSAGLWSGYYQSGPILVDKTIPVITDFDQDMSPDIIFDSRFTGTVEDLDNFYIRSATIADRSSLDSNDMQSGIERVEYGLWSEGNIDSWRILDWTPSALTYQLLLDDMTMNGFNFEDGNRYTIAVRTMNGAGEYSDISFSREIIADLTNPEITFEFTETENNYHQDESGRYIVNNNPLASGDYLPIRFTINEQTSEKVFVTLEIVKPDKSTRLKLLEKEIESSGGVWPVQETEFDFADADSDYGEYIIVARVTDASGRYTNYAPDDQYKPVLWLNDPPQERAELPFYLTTPGAPAELTPYYINGDGEQEQLYIDNDGALSYSWSVISLPVDFSPTNSKQEFITYMSGSNPEYTEIASGSGNVFTEAFFHRNNNAGVPDISRAVSDYGVLTVATDPYGKSALFYNVLKVVNTSSGPLYTDEIWSTDMYGESHKLTGIVTVGNTLDLSIQEDSVIEAAITSEDEGNEYTDKGVIVNGHLDTGPGVEFGVTDDQEIFWRGILVYGNAEFNGTESRPITISRAERGMTAGVGSAVTLEWLILRSNEIGIHVLEPGLLIRNCVFEGSKGYAIKEDNNSDPIVQNNTFTGNTFDYYNSNHDGTGKTVLDVQGIYELDEINNTGNTGDEE